MLFSFPLSLSKIGKILSLDVALHLCFIINLYKDDDDFDDFDDERSSWRCEIFLLSLFLSFFLSFFRFNVVGVIHACENIQREREREMSLQRFFSLSLSLKLGRGALCLTSIRGRRRFFV